MDLVVKLDQPDPPQDPWSIPGGPGIGPGLAASLDPWSNVPGGSVGSPSGQTPPPGQQTPVSSQDRRGGTTAGPSEPPTGGSSPSLQAKVDDLKVVDKSPSLVLSDEPPPPPPPATSQNPVGSDPGRPNGNPQGGIPPGQQNAKLVTVAPSSLPPSQQPPPSTSDQRCLPGGLNGPPEGGVDPPVDKIAESSPISALQNTPTDTKQPLTSWRQAFPQNPGLYVHIKSGEPVDIRVSPPSQQRSLTQLANSPALASYPATPGQRLALEAYLLDSQIRGLSALSSRMDLDVSGMDPAMLDVQNQLKHITELLQKANEASYTLYRDVYLSTVSGQTG